MQTYELVVLFHPDLEIDLDTPVKKVEKLMTDAGGKILKTDNWGKRKLAYPIRKQDFGVYVYWEVDLDGDSVAKIDRGLNMADEVLRHLITKHVEAPVEEDKDDKSSDKSEKEEKVEKEDKA